MVDLKALKAKHNSIVNNEDIDEDEKTKQHLKLTLNFGKTALGLIAKKNYIEDSDIVINDMKKAIREINKEIDKIK